MMPSKLGRSFAHRGGLNNGRYPDKVINEAVALLRGGTARRDVIDILREKYAYENLNRRTLDRWYSTYPLGKGPQGKGLESRLRDLARQEAQRIDTEKSQNLRMQAHRTDLLDSLDGLRGV